MSPARQPGPRQLSCILPDTDGATVQKEMTMRGSTHSAASHPRSSKDEEVCRRWVGDSENRFIHDNAETGIYRDRIEIVHIRAHCRAKIVMHLINRAGRDCVDCRRYQTSQVCHRV